MFALVVCWLISGFSFMNLLAYSSSGEETGVKEPWL